VYAQSTFLIGATSASLLGGCSPSDEAQEYERLADAERLPGRATGSEGPDYNELVRCATLAPNSHNTQPWKFSVADGAIAIQPDYSRRCPAVDPDDHHLFVSLGCATENLMLAARAQGFGGTARYDPAADAVTIRLARAKPYASELFEMIPKRQSTRSVFERRAVPNDDLATLRAASTGDGVRLLMLHESKDIDAVASFVATANSFQMAEPGFMRELKTWVRFSYRQALASRDGLFSACMGTPVVPAWLGKMAFNFAVTAPSENKTYVEQVRSSPGVAVFVSERSDKPHWVEAGRCAQRFLLQATALGLKTAFVNQPVEVASVRAKFAAYLGVGGRRPDLIVRFGYASEVPRSLRRPPAEVLTVA
jgi:nitroreductase